jgi:TPR repeat protein
MSSSVCEAQFNRGNMYRTGEGVPQDDVEAVKWWSKAAEQGYASAQFNLGDMYRTGEGVPQDDVEAVKWYRKAAEQGMAGSQFNLGIRYSNGNGASEDDTPAVRVPVAALCITADRCQLHPPPSHHIVRQGQRIAG